MPEILNDNNVVYDIAKNIMDNLSMEERNQLFSIVTDNVDLFRKLLPGSPFMRMVKFNESIDLPIGIAYNTWKTLNSET